MRLIKSFGFALAGVRYFFLREANGRIHLLGAAGAITLAIFLHLTLSEWIIVCLCISAVLSAEMFNSAIELIADFISPAKAERIKRIKDIAAAAVLTVSVAAACIGGIIFIPKLIDAI